MTASDRRSPPAQFRAAMGAFPTGVTVVTTTLDGALYGMTVNAFCSISLDPLLLMVSLRADCRGLQLVDSAATFAVNVLAATQQDVSAWFANSSRPGDSSMFDGVPIRLGATGCPVLLDAAAAFECRVDALHPAGDHVIVIGAVLDLTHRPDIEPLVFHGGRYAGVSAVVDEPRPALSAA